MNSIEISEFSKCTFFKKFKRAAVSAHPSFKIIFLNLLAILEDILFINLSLLFILSPAIKSKSKFFENSCNNKLISLDHFDNHHQ